MLGLAFIGTTFAVIALVLGQQLEPPPSVTRVTFAFPGFEQGQYPDGSPFQADDLRSPAVIDEALRRLGLNASGDLQSRLRGALTVEGIIPGNLLKDRAKQRAAGQTLPPYVPDEYHFILKASRELALPAADRERLLAEIVNACRENFRRTYGQAPLAYGTAFETLDNADFPEHQLVLNAEIENIRAYIRTRADTAPGFRAPSTNLSFRDILEQTELFAQLHLNEVLSQIHQNGLSRDRSTAQVKLNYLLRLVEDRERRALEEERVVCSLLEQAQSRTQNYLLGIKDRAAEPRLEAPLLDQALVDSLLANDSYNFLVRRALDVGLRVKAVQAEKARLIDLRENMQLFEREVATDQSAIIERVEDSLQTLKLNYRRLITAIRHTHADYAQQEFGNSIRLSDEVHTAGLLGPLVKAGVVGGALGFALGAGLSLLGIYFGPGRGKTLPHAAPGLGSTKSLNT